MWGLGYWGDECIGGGKKGRGAECQRTGASSFKWPLKYEGEESGGGSPDSLAHKRLFHSRPADGSTIPPGKAPSRLRVVHGMVGRRWVSGTRGRCVGDGTRAGMHRPAGGFFPSNTFLVTVLTQRTLPMPPAASAAGMGTIYAGYKGRIKPEPSRSGAFVIGKVLGITTPAAASSASENGRT